MEQGHLIPTYARQPVAFSHGEGCWLWDTAGRRYLDALGGIAVNTLGHAHPALTAALTAQAGRVIHLSNLYCIPEQEALADKLCAAAGMDAVFFGNSGAEANEAAIKLARLHGHHKGIDLPAIVVMDGAFHGRTLASLAATANPKAKQGFEPMPDGFVRVPFNDVGAVRQLAERTDIAAILVEPIQGEGGVRVPDPGYLRQLAEICDQQDWLMMVDEVQSGIGRTGRWFAHQHDDIRPDVMSLAKGLGGGVPIGACVVAGRARSLFGPGSHGSTFGGNPLSSAAGLAVMDSIEADGLLHNAAARGAQLIDGLRTALAGCEAVADIRGAGLMLGIELDRPCGELVHAAREAGLLINVAAERTIRLLPPLVLSDAEAADLMDRLVPLIQDFLNKPSKPGS
jgi:acetylornithine aminotransferase